MFSDRNGIAACRYYEALASEVYVLEMYVAQTVVDAILSSVEVFGFQLEYFFEQ